MGYLFLYKQQKWKKKKRKERKEEEIAKFCRQHWQKYLCFKLFSFGSMVQRLPPEDEHCVGGSMSKVNSEVSRVQSMLKKPAGFLKIVFSSMTAEVWRSPVWLRCTNWRKYFFLFRFFLFNKDIVKSTSQLKKNQPNFRKQEWTEIEFEDSIKRSEKGMQSSFVLEVLYLETEISEVCSARFTVLPNLYRFLRRYFATIMEILLEKSWKCFSIFFSSQLWFWKKILIDFALI